MTSTADPASRAIPLVPGVPFLGNLPSVALDVLGFLERAEARGSTVTELRFPNRRSFLVTDPDLVERVLVTDNKNFTKDLFLKDMKRVLGEGLLTSEGDFWR